MNRYIFFIQWAIVVISIASCTRSDNLLLYIKFDSVRNLKEGSEVYCKNIPIGKVTDLKILADHKILAKVDLKLSSSALDTFALVNYDYFGSQVIEVIPAKDIGKKLESGDTVTGLILNIEPIIRLDSATRKIARDSLITPFIRKIK